MNIGNVMGASNSVSTAKAQETNDTSSLDRKIEQLKKQIEQINKNDKLSQEEKDKRVANIENQVVQLEQQNGQESRNASSVEMKKGLIPMKHNHSNSRRGCIKWPTITKDAKSSK